MSNRTSRKSCKVTEIRRSYDIDKNCTTDPLLTHVVDGKEYTFLGKDEIEKQVPTLKKKYPHYRDFAGKTVDQIFGDSLKGSTPLKVTSFTSGVFYNKGNGNFQFKAFPASAQTAPLFGFADIRGPMNCILAGGNFSGVLPFEGRYDADYGDVLFVDKQGGFKWQSPVASGFLLRGEVRDIKVIKTADGTIYAVAINNNAIKFFKVNKKHE